MSLETGIYTIQSKSTQYHVGRFYIEDLSLRPKRVMSLSQNVGAKPPHWLIEKTGDTYRLKALDAYTAVLEGKLFAIHLSEPEPVDWVINAHPEQGDNVYSIETENGSGWTVVAGDENDPEAQIEIHPVHQDASNQLFTLVKLS
ncbi:hypothetical protein TWF506_009595 [Arthrobotrys conoides]|uniref:Ricin B lectin domain-containing protein n=1 Tax=Arthrobotrys conoides TaxID=74498 RepID=A0AAN8PCN5_9PEZI